MWYLLKIIPFVSLLVGTLLVTQCSLSAQKPKREKPSARWEAIFFRSIDAATKVSKIAPLREKPLRPHEVEIRVWRGFGLSPLEGVSINRSGATSSGIHIVGNDYYDITHTEVNQLGAPKGGWDSFWADLTRMGLFQMPEPKEEDCHGQTIDGMGYVVEISNQGVYRTYMYPSGLVKCQNSLQMDKIGEFIGEAFHDGARQCKEAEWFPCSESLRKRREAELER